MVILSFLTMLSCSGIETYSPLATLGKGTCEPKITVFVSYTNSSATGKHEASRLQLWSPAGAGPRGRGDQETACAPRTVGPAPHALS